MGTKAKIVKKIAKAKTAKRVPAAERLLPNGKGYGLPAWALLAGRKALDQHPNAVGLVYDTSHLFVIEPRTDGIGGVIDEGGKRFEIFCGPVVGSGELMLVENHIERDPTLEDAIDCILRNSEFSRELIREGSVSSVDLPSVVITEGFAFQGNVVPADSSGAA